MSKKWAIMATVMLITACGGNKNAANDTDAVSEVHHAPGDSTLYGLACDGCNDTIVLLLPHTGDDPDTFNVLEASRAHRVFGHPEIGDKLALVLNADNPKVADAVINMEKLKGEWCYMVKPILRERAGMNREIRRHEVNPELDSILNQLLQPREFGFEIKSEHICRPISVGRELLSEDSPVIFPPVKRYREWHIYNGKLLLTTSTRDSQGEKKTADTDTAEFVMMFRDSLVLRFSDGERGYYRKAK